MGGRTTEVEGAPKQGDRSIDRPVSLGRVAERLQTLHMVLRSPAKMRPAPKRPEEPRVMEEEVVSVPESSTSRSGRIDEQI